MANTYTKISTVTVGAGGAASINFTSIPQTYTDLCVKLTFRDASVGAINNYVDVRPNSSTSSQTSRRIQGNGSSASSASFSIIYVPINSNISTSNTFGNAEIYIPNYAGSAFKSFSIDAVTENNATSAIAELWAALWSNTAAITSLEIGNSGSNLLQYSTATLYGISVGVKATGGTITSDANYFYHTFNASGTFTPTQSLTCDYLVVAGGGGGGGRFGGGGAGGGYRTSIGGSALSLTTTPYTVTIGAGGAGSPDAGASSVRGLNGSDSIFSTITSTAGGGGGGPGSTLAIQSGADGGSGGGTCGFNAGVVVGLGNTPSTSPSQGNNGGLGTSTTNFFGGGGGGAGAVGGDFVVSTRAGNGGAGTASSITGTSVTRGGGGGGGAFSGTAGTGGTGGGGNGGAGAAGGAGTVNTGGGGGGGGGSGRSGGTGGSGIVIVRYAR